LNDIPEILKHALAPFAPPEVDVAEKHFAGSTEYVIRGEKDAVAAEVRRILAEYHPTGYGTRVKYTEEGAEVWRANSCD
jgi:hypothetical protein